MFSFQFLAMKLNVINVFFLRSTYSNLHVTCKYHPGFYLSGLRIS